MPTDLKQTLRKLVDAWERDFRAMAAGKDRAVIASLSGAVEKGRTPRQKAFALKTALEREVAFVKYMVTCKYLDRMSAEGIAGIRRFLSMQTEIVDPDPAAGPRYTVLLPMDDYLRVFAGLDGLGDIDFADAYAGTGFQGVGVLDTSVSKVSAAQIRAIVRHVREDLEFDYGNVTVKVAMKPDAESSWLLLRTEIGGEVGLDKAARIQRCREWFGVNVLGWMGDP